MSKVLCYVLHCIKYNELLVSHLSTNYISPHGLVLFVGDRQVFGGKDMNAASRFHKDAAYAISKMGTMSAAVQLANRREIVMNSIISTILP